VPRLKKKSRAIPVLHLEQAMKVKYNKK